MIKTGGMPLQEIWNYRIQSPFFDVDFPNDNDFGIPKGTYLPVTGVHWVFLESLPPGKHEI